MDRVDVPIKMAMVVVVADGEDEHGSFTKIQSRSGVEYTGILIITV
jgi:hypothetical protein